MHRHEWTDFNEQISFIPADYPEGEVRILVDGPEDKSIDYFAEISIGKEEFQQLIDQIKERMSW